MQTKSHSTVSRPQSPAPVLEPFLLDIRPIFAQGASPCATIDQAVAGLCPGQNLILLAPFEPIPLFTKLAAQGFEHKSEPMSDGSWKILFERTGVDSGAEGNPQSCCCSGNR